MPTREQRFEIYNRLLGKVLRKSSNSFDRDYSGGSSFFEDSSAIFLYKNDTFRFEHSSFTSLSSGGLSLSSGGSGQQVVEGTWWIRSDGFNPLLELKHPDGTIFKNIVLSVSNQQGIEYLDGVAWDRYRIE